MLIFVILSTTEAYFPAQSQINNHPCNHRSRVLLSRLSPLLPSIHPHLRRPLYHRGISCPVTSSFSPVLPPPPSPPCPPSHPSFPHPSSPSPPSVSPPLYYADQRSNFPEGLSKSYEGNYKGQQLSDEIYQTKNDAINTVTVSSYFSFPARSTMDVTYHINPLTSNLANYTKPSQPLPSHPSIITDKNSSIQSPPPISQPQKQQQRQQQKQQQPPQQSTTVEDRFPDGKAKSSENYAIKYLIKTNCSSNDNNCPIYDFRMPPENDCCTNCSIPCRFRYIRRTSLRSDQLREVDPVCNNESLRRIITEQMDDDISKSKIRIQQRARIILGGLYEVICGTDDFAYIIHTKDFCQHQKGTVTCYAFRLLADYNDTHTP